MQNATLLTLPAEAGAYVGTDCSAPVLVAVGEAFGDVLGEAFGDVLALGVE